MSYVFHFNLVFKKRIKMVVGSFFPGASSLWRVEIRSSINLYVRIHGYFLDLD